VKNAAGIAVYDGPVQFIEAGAMFKSSGSLNVASGMTKTDGSPVQLGIQGWFLPTMAGMSPTEGPVSAFPAPGNPALIITAFTGDLGDTQSVFSFDTSKATQLDLDPANAGNKGVALYLGKDDAGKDIDTVQLPDGLGSVTFEGYKQYAQFDINHDPSKTPVFASAIGIVGGLLLSLGIRRRRIFVRVRPGGDGLRVEVAGLARSEDARLRDEVKGIGSGLRPKRSKQAGQVKQAEAGAGR
jgi:cytochrome c biogenesis protein